MAIKKPLVLSSGLIEQLQAGDTLAAFAVENLSIQLTNLNAGSIVIGTPVYIITAGNVDKARANAASTREVVGLVADTSILTTATGAIATAGMLTATTGQWDAVTGGTGGLTAGSVYFLDPATAGMMTLTGPTTDGQHVCRLGVALSTTKFQIEIQTPIKL